MLLTTVLLLRPGDMSPAVEDVPFYLVSLALCTVLLLPELAAQLRVASLKAHPITICVLGAAGAAILSNLVKGNFSDTKATASDCMKFVMYYLLLIGCVNSSVRLRQFLIWNVFLIVVVCALGMLQYYGYIDVQAQPYVESQDYNDPVTGQPVVLSRLCSVGIFNNPNDLARVIIVGIVLCLYCMGDKRQWLARFLWVVPIVIFCQALSMTASRGGFLGLLAGIATLMVIRLGRTKSIFLGILLLPAIFYVFAGRITDIDTSEGTGQQRIQIWRDAFSEMHGSPIFGIGVGNIEDVTGGLLAHNSFVQAYAETGIVGGIFFTGAFFLSIWGPYRLTPYVGRLRDPELRRMHPFLMAVLCESVVGMMSSTRNLRVDTYLLLGIITVYLTLVERNLPQLALRADRKLCLRVFGVGLLFLVVLDVFVRVAANVGG
jgi:O-antigen ligase